MEILAKASENQKPTKKQYFRKKIQRNKISIVGKKRTCAWACACACACVCACACA